MTVTLDEAMTQMTELYDQANALLVEERNEQMLKSGMTAEAAAIEAAAFAEDLKGTRALGLSVLRLALIEHHSRGGSVDV